MTKVKTIRVQNLKAIPEKEVNFNGCTAIIMGGNNRGKTSLLRGLTDRLANNTASDVVHHGAENGFAEWTLTSGEKLIWDFKNNDKGGLTEKLTYVSERDIKGSITMDLRKRLFGIPFDIDSFLNESSAEQYKKLEKMAGMDFTHINARHKAAYDDRTYKKKKSTEEAARLLPVDTTLGKELLPTEEIEKELENIGTHNANILRAKEAKQGHKNLTENSEKLIGEKRQRIDDLLKQVEQIKTEIIAEEDANRVRLDSIIKIDNWMEAPENQPKDEAYVSQKTAELAQIKADNEAIIENNKRIAAKESHAAIEQAAADADAAVKKIEAEKAEMVKGAKLPEGFGFSGETITYNGLPFTKAQLSSSAIYIAALKLASSTMGEVKMLHFDASTLDRISLDEVHAWAEPQGLQLLIERPDFEGGEIKYELIEKTAEHE